MGRAAFLCLPLSSGPFDFLENGHAYADERHSEQAEQDRLGNQLFQNASHQAKAIRQGCGDIRHSQAALDTNRHKFQHT